MTSMCRNSKRLPGEVAMREDPSSKNSEGVLWGKRGTDNMEDRRRVQRRRRKHDQ